MSPVSTSSHTPRGAALPDGIYVPTVTFFSDDKEQSLDLNTYAAHIKFMADAGVTGITVQGSTGEAVALSRDERNQITKTTRDVLNAVRPQAYTPIIVGSVGAQTTQQAIHYCQDAAANGGDFALVLPPAYYASALAKQDIERFYVDVADASPLPVLIYSYPAVSGGIDMDTDLLSTLAKHDNIVGIKHTDHSLSKQTRLASLRHTFGTFSVLGGASDYLLASLSVGAQGCITGMGNVAPRTVMRAYNAFRAGELDEARNLAGEIAHGEWALGKGSINGVKYAVSYHNGLPIHCSYPRKPLAPASDVVMGWQEKELVSLVAIERQLEKEAGQEGQYGTSIPDDIMPSRLKIRTAALAD